MKSGYSGQSKENEFGVRVDARQSRLLLRIFDEGANVARRRVLVGEIDSLVSRNGLRFDRSQRESLDRLADQDVIEFYRQLVDSRDRQAFLSAYEGPVPG